MNQKTPTHNLNSLGLDSKIEIKKLDNSYTHTADHSKKESNGIPDALNKALNDKQKVQQITKDMLDAERSRSQLMKAELESLRQINTQLREDINESSRLYENQLQTLSKLKNRIDDLEKQYSTAKNEIEELNNEKYALEKKNNEYHTIINMQAQQVDEQQELLNQLQPIVSQLKDELEIIKSSELGSIDQQHTYTEMKYLREENDRLKSEVNAQRELIRNINYENKIASQPVKAVERIIEEEASISLEKPEQDISSENKNNDEITNYENNENYSANTKIEELPPENNNKTDENQNQPLQNEAHNVNEENSLTVDETEEIEQKYLEDQTKCPNCQSDNPYIAKFCGYCGSPMKVSKIN